jgi:hypothetical protein
MSAPTNIRSTAGFRNFSVFELTASGSWLGLPLGALTLEKVTPFAVTSGSPAGTAAAAIPAGGTVSGSVPYYGVTVSGAKVLTINDPAPRVIPHIGDDGVFSLQVLPALEPVTGELRVDKTNDIVDALVGNVKKVTVGESNVMGQATNQRGFENQVGALAYSAAQDTDPNSTSFGTNLWDWRVMPKVILFTRDTGYQQEANERMYTLSPMYVTAHLWGVQFTASVEGFTRGQLIRGISQYKPCVVGYKGDASAKAFCFDSAKPAASTAKVTVWQNGALVTSGSATYSPTLYGVVFTTAPAATDVITVLYETS